MRSRPVILLALALMAGGLGLASAEDPTPGDVDVSATVASIESNVLAWTKLVPPELDLRAEVLEQSDSIVGDAHMRSWTTLAPKLRELRSKLVLRRERVIFGTALPDAAPLAHDDREFAAIDARIRCNDVFLETAPSLGLQGRCASLATDGERHLRRTFEADKLHELAGMALHEAGDDGVPVVVANGFLFLRASPAGIARVRDLLENLRALTATRIAFELRTYRMPRAFASELCRLSSGVALSAEAEALLAEALAKGTVSLQGSRSLLGRDGWPLASFSGEQRTYVSQVDATHGASIARISTELYTGERLVLRATLAPGRKSAFLDAELGQAELTGPPAKETELGCDLELPELAFTRVETRAEIPLERTALVAGSYGPDATGNGPALARVVTVRVSVVADRGAGPTAPPKAVPPEPRQKPLVDYSAADRQELGLLETLLPLIDATIARLSDVYRYGFFDVRNIVSWHDDRRSLPLGLLLPEPGLQRSEVEPFFERNDDGAFVSPEQLEVLLRGVTGADEAWVDPALYELHGGTLIIHQTPAVLARVEEVLASLRRSRGKPLRFEASLYRFEPGVAESLAAAGTKEGEPAGVLPASALAALEEAVTRGRAVSLGGGFVIAQEGERVYLQQGHERACVAGFEPLPGSQGLHPIVGLVRTGTTLEVLGEPDAITEGRLSVMARATRVTEGERHATASSLGRFETPTLALDTLTARAALRSGKALLVVVSNASAPQGGSVAFVVRAENP